MANELNIALSTGLTVTAQPYTAGAASGSPISLSEVGTTGFYTGDMAGSAGTYQLVFLASGATVGTGQITWSGTAEVPVSTLTTADIPTSDITAIKAATDNLPASPAAVSDIPTASENATAVRTELTTELAHLDADVSSRATSADIPSSDISAIKTKTDALETTRLAQCSTVATTGAQLAAALS